MQENGIRGLSLKKKERESERERATKMKQAKNLESCATLWAMIANWKTMNDSMEKQYRHQSQHMHTCWKFETLYFACFL